MGSDGKPDYRACDGAKTTVGASILRIIEVFSQLFAADTQAVPTSCAMHITQKENWSLSFRLQGKSVLATQQWAQHGQKDSRDHCSGLLLPVR